jgi:hypothetical protein
MMLNARAVLIALLALALKCSQDNYATVYCLSLPAHQIHAKIMAGVNQIARALYAGALKISLDLNVRVTLIHVDILSVKMEEHALDRTQSQCVCAHPSTQARLATRPSSHVMNSLSVAPMVDVKKWRA